MGENRREGWKMPEFKKLNKGNKSSWQVRAARTNDENIFNMSVFGGSEVSGQNQKTLRIDDLTLYTAKN